MSTKDSIQCVRIYLSERDTAEGQPLFQVLLERLQREGATGATALRGVAGFGAGHRLYTGGSTDAGHNVPIVVEWIDRAERVARVLPRIDDLLSSALVSIEDVRVYRAALRPNGPFGGQSVGNVAQHDTATATADTLLSEAAQLLIERDQTVLPVLDSQRRVVGLLHADDFAPRPVAEGSPVRATLPLPVRLLRVLPRNERDAVLSTLPQETLASLINREPQVVSSEAPVAVTARMLVEWGHTALPVVDETQQYVGLFGINEVLNAALRRPTAGGAVRDAEPAALVRLLMQGAVPSVAAATPAAEATALLWNAPERFLIVLDEGRPLGTLDDAWLARALPEPYRTAWLSALANAAATPHLERMPAARAADLPLAPAPTIVATATRDDALRLLLEQHAERLVVVDDEARVIGLIGRRGLLRGLSQESDS